MIYMPNDSKRASRMIEKNGGIRVFIPECCCYQVSDSEDDLSMYMKGPVYSDKWITDSIEAGQLLPCKSYLLTTMMHSESQISFSRTKFTVREIHKIYSLV